MTNQRLNALATSSIQKDIKEHGTLQPASNWEVCNCKNTACRVLVQILCKLIQILWWTGWVYWIFLLFGQFIVNQYAFCLSARFSLYYCAKFGVKQVRPTSKHCKTNYMNLFHCFLKFNFKLDFSNLWNEYFSNSIKNNMTKVEENAIVWPKLLHLTVDFDGFIYWYYYCNLIWWFP